MNKHKNCRCSTFYGPQENDRIIREDKKRKKQVEKELKTKFSDADWFIHKVNSMFTNKNN